MRNSNKNMLKISYFYLLFSVFLLFAISVKCSSPDNENFSYDGDSFDDEYNEDWEDFTEDDDF